MTNTLHVVSLGALALAPMVVGALGSTTTTKQCVQLEVSIPVVATNYHYTMPRVDSSIDAIDWTLNVTTWSTPNATVRITNPVPVNRTFSVSAQLCVPSQRSTKSNILQIAAHGNGFDRRSAVQCK